MKLTRRTALLGLLSTGISVIANRFNPAKAQISHFLNETDVPLRWLNHNQLDTEILYQHFLKLAKDGVEDEPILMYQGIKTSPYQNQIDEYPSGLRDKPDGKNIISAIQSDQNFHSYPMVGELPYIDDEGLLFLHKNIKEACVCLGSFSDGEFKTKWLGRNSLVTGEFWSATKMIPLLNLISRVNNQNKQNIENYYIKGINQEGNEVSFSFEDLGKDLISYDNTIASSNSIGAMFKRFIPQLELEKWVKSITGNKNLVFRGKYGDQPFIDQPKLIDNNTGEVIFFPDIENPRWACNEVSAYDLTRLISMIGWHNYIHENCRLPGVKWYSLKSLIKILGNDPARLTDLAIQSLGLENDVDGVVILSKLGNGATGLRARTEAVYVALINLIDRRSQPAKQLTMTMAMRGGLAFNPRDFDQEVVNLDARMATEVTRLIWKVLSDNDYN